MWRLPNFWLKQKLTDGNFGETYRLRNIKGVVVTQIRNAMSMIGHNGHGWCGLWNANVEEEPRTSDGDGRDGTDELTVNTNVQITARPHRRPSPGFDESPTLIKPIPRGSSFFVFSHTNRLAQFANGQTNPISFSFFFFSFPFRVCVCSWRPPKPFRHFFFFQNYYSNSPATLLYIFSFTHTISALCFSISAPLSPNCCKLALSRRGLGWRSRILWWW